MTAIVRAINKHLNKTGLTTLLMITLISLLIVVKVVLPKSQISQLAVETGALIGLMGFLINIGTEAKTAAQEARRVELEEINNRIRDVEEEVRKLGVELSTHSSAYGHTGSATQLFKLQEKVIQLEVELRMSKDITDLQDRLSEISKKVS